MMTKTFKTMEDAAKYAAGICTAWKFKDEDEHIDKDFFIFSCGEQDAACGLDQNDDESYYVVSDEGAVGLTEDDGECIDWLYLPVGRSLASLPTSLRM